MTSAALLCSAFVHRYRPPHPAITHSLRPLASVCVCCGRWSVFDALGGSSRPAPPVGALRDCGVCMTECRVNRCRRVVLIGEIFHAFDVDLGVNTRRTEHLSLLSTVPYLVSISSLHFERRRRRVICARRLAASDSSPRRTASAVTVCMNRTWSCVYARAAGVSHTILHNVYGSLCVLCVVEPPDGGRMRPPRRGPGLYAEQRVIL